MKKCVIFFFEHWSAFIGFLTFVASIVIAALIFNRNIWDKNNHFEYVCVVCIVISFLAFFFSKELLNDSPDRITRITKVIITFCIILFFVSTILLGRFVFVTEEEISHEEPIGGKETICYTTDTGDYYHKISCGYLKSINKTTQYNAEMDGYLPCSACYDGIGLRWHTITEIKPVYMYWLAFLISLVLWSGLCALLLLLYNKRLAKKNNLVCGTIDKKDKKKNTKSKIAVQIKDNLAVNTIVAVVICLFGYVISTIMLFCFDYEKNSTGLFITCCAIYPVLFILAAGIERHRGDKSLTELWQSIPLLIIIVLTVAVGKDNPNVMIIIEKATPYAVSTSIGIFLHGMLKYY
ncbi:hypothetical protein [Ruminococcus sp.]|uniref:hypothetical protein n=1 Tax=Ruminococcus sp. TaxID=41978 RepID=UPI0038904B3B